MKNDVELCLTKSDLETKFNFPKRNPTLIDLILYYFDDEFLDLMIKTNVEINEMKDLPPIFFNKLTKTQRRDIIK